MFELVSEADGMPRSLSITDIKTDKVLDITYMGDDRRRRVTLVTINKVHHEDFLCFPFNTDSLLRFQSRNPFGGPLSDGDRSPATSVFFLYWEYLKRNQTRLSCRRLCPMKH
jgi:hypothetical protein